MDIETRFWSKVAKSERCWTWTGYIGPHGYGTFRDGRGKAVAAHRFALALALGQPLLGLALHKCDRRDCVRPDHLYEGSHDDNARDRRERGRMPRGSRHPHAVTDEKTACEIARRWKQGERQTALAKELRLSKSLVNQIVRGGCWSHVTGIREPVRDFAARLTEAQVRVVLRRLHAGATQISLAKKFSVCRSTINHIALGTTWKHLHRDPLAAVPRKG